jgi:hypothetical protein
MPLALVLTTEGADMVVVGGVVVALAGAGVGVGVEEEDIRLLVHSFLLKT